MSGGGSTSSALSSMSAYEQAWKRQGQALENVATGRSSNFGKDIMVGVSGPIGEDLMGGMTPPEAQSPDAAPTMEDVAAREPNKERRRRQRMAALMAQGRQGTILTGPGGTTPNNSVGGGGKQMVGA